MSGPLESAARIGIRLVLWEGPHKGREVQFAVARALNCGESTVRRAAVTLVRDGSLRTGLWGWSKNSTFGVEEQRGCFHPLELRTAILDAVAERRQPATGDEHDEMLAQWHDDLEQVMKGPDADLLANEAYVRGEE